MSSTNSAPTSSASTCSPCTYSTVSPVAGPSGELTGRGGRSAWPRRRPPRSPSARSRRDRAGRCSRVSRSCSTARLATGIAVAGFGAAGFGPAAGLGGGTGLGGGGGTSTPNDAANSCQSPLGRLWATSAAFFLTRGGGAGGRTCGREGRGALSAPNSEASESQLLDFSVSLMGREGSFVFCCHPSGAL